MNDTLILGVGNPILRDDGVGIHAIRTLRSRITDADFEEASLSGLELIESMQGYKKVILIDAVRTKTGKPGEIYSLTPQDLPTLHGNSPHDMDFRTALEYHNKYAGITPEIKIYGIEVENTTEYGETLSASVQEALPALIEKIVEEHNEP